MRAQGAASEEPRLRRSLGTGLLTVYGLGTMVGGGFYALLGRVAGEAGSFGPVAFGVAALLGLLNAFTFAELSSRFPSSAGEARYVEEAFGRPRLGAAVGWLVIATGVVSAATLSRAFAGFLFDLVPVPELAGVVFIVLALGLVAAWGVAESVFLAAVITAIEVGALLVVLWLGRESLAAAPARLDELVPPASWETWKGIGLGAFLAFYSFVGFEDMVNMAEEVRTPKRALPRAILLALLGTTVLYVLVSTTAALAVSPEALNESRTPLALLVGDGGWRTTAIVLVSMLAGVNGALVQIVMASRVAYGMGSRDVAPRWLAVVHPRTQTPVRATALAAALVLALALWFPLVTLARLTSGIILVVFVSVNAALLAIKAREQDPPAEALRLPAPVTWLALVACLSLLALQVGTGVFSGGH